MNEKQRKSTFPRGGKSKISENRLSLTGENQKSAKIGFPSRGKTRNQRKTTFPHGGKSKNNEEQLSLTGEIGKLRKLDKTFGVMFILTLHCSLFCKSKADLWDYSASLRSSILSPCVGASVFSKSVIPAFTRMSYH